MRQLGRLSELLSRVYRTYHSACSLTHIRYQYFVREHATLLMFLSGLAILSVGLTELSVAQGRQPESPEDFYYDYKPIRGSVELLFNLIEGSFGALIMVISGIGAIIAAAFGAYRAAVSLIIVAVGAFVLRSLVSLFFGTFDKEDVDAVWPGRLDRGADAPFKIPRDYGGRGGRDDYDDGGFNFDDPIDLRIR